ncbi:hypothetical protein EON82_24735 [bacterium]|nr:MAG: hypothetical protein EON82_24735 [bacterium]
MRGKTALIIRLICSLALVVAAWPAKASAEPCAMPAPAAAPAMADCGMLCCEKKPEAKAMACEKHVAKTLACCKEKTAELAAPSPHQGPELASAIDPCKCEIKSAPSAPIEAPKAVVSGFDHHAFVAVLPDAPPELPSSLEVSEPGIYGVDSGPPTSAAHLSDFGRAPPVARA